MKPRFFVVMPFGEKEVQPAAPAAGAQAAQPALKIDFDEVYKVLIAPAIVRAGCQPFRADEEASAGDIRTDMFFELVTADVVLADISILNPNVFYELGVRHGVAPRGVFMIHAGWSKRPFDIAPDRTFDYEGTLFEPSKNRDEAWTQRVNAEVEKIATNLKNAIAVDEQTIGSPVYKELVGLRPVDWSGIETARAKYFGGVLDDWQSRVSVAQKNGYVGDILTLKDDAPTRLHQSKLLWSAAKALIALPRFEVAHTILKELIALDETHRDAQCQLGLVLGRVGKMAEAEEHMVRMAQLYCGDPEAQGILGRVYKDLWRARWEEMPSDEERQQAAIAASSSAASAIRSYAAALRFHLDSYYNGINVVSLLALLKHLKKVTGKTPVDSGVKDSSDLIAVVRVAARSALERAQQKNQQEDVIWATATLAELELAVGKSDEALSLYEAAAYTPGVTRFQISSMLDQLNVFGKLAFQPEAVAKIEKSLESSLKPLMKLDVQFDKVVVCSGHLIDAPGRKEPRFPPDKEGSVRDKLAMQLEDWKIGAGDLAICGAARGADILFAELCAERGAHVRLFIALPEAEFIEESVRLPNSHWVERYYQLRKHPQIETCFQFERLGSPPEGVSAFARDNLWMINTARVEARPGDLYAVLVWDEKPTGDGPGGTSDFAEKVRQLGGHLEIINPTLL